MSWLISEPLPRADLSTGATTLTRTLTPLVPESSDLSPTSPFPWRPWVGGGSQVSEHELTCVSRPGHFLNPLLSLLQNPVSHRALMCMGNTGGTRSRRFLPSRVTWGSDVSLAWGQSHLRGGGGLQCRCLAGGKCPSCCPGLSQMTTDVCHSIAWEVA